MSDRLQEAIDQLRTAERRADEYDQARKTQHDTEGRTVYTERKTARNRVAEILREMGLDGFSIGGER